MMNLIAPDLSDSEITTIAQLKSEIPPKKTIPPALRKEFKKLKKANKKQIKQIETRGKERRIKKDELAREDKYGEKTRRKMEKRWRKMLLDIKLPILKKEFTYAMNTAERMIDAKDYIISLTLDEIDHASEQFTLNLQNHIESIDRLIFLMHDRLREVKERYDADLKSLFQSKDDDIDLLRKRMENDDDFLNMMVYGLEVENKNHIKNIRSEYMSKISAESKRYDQLLVFKKTELQRIFEKMWSQYETLAKDFLEQTSDRRKEYEKLKERDTVMRNIMDDQIRMILKIYEDISSEKNLQVYQRTVIEEAERDLMEEEQCFGSTFNKLKVKLIKDAKKDNSQLIILTQLSNSVLKNLNETKLKGEKILRYMTLCRKYETEYEKVLSFPGPDTNVHNVPDKKYPLIRAFTAIGIPESKGLDNFWQKCGQADATRHILNQEKEYLTKENEHLKAALKKYCRKNICRCRFFPQVTRMPSDECILIYKKKDKEIF